MTALENQWNTPLKRDEYRRTHDPVGTRLAERGLSPSEEPRIHWDGPNTSFVSSGEVSSSRESARSADSETASATPNGFVTAVKVGGALLGGFVALGLTLDIIDRFAKACAGSSPATTPDNDSEQSPDEYRPYSRRSPLSREP